MLAHKISFGIFEKMSLVPKVIFENALVHIPDFYEKGEKRVIAIELMTSHLNIDANELLKNTMEIDDSSVYYQNFLADLNRIEKGEPFQYVEGEVKFNGLSFNVEQGVLIPRPETEELALWVEEELNGKVGKGLDIGTGSGCLGIYLGKKLPGLNFICLDVSGQALKIAEKNADLNAVPIDFLQHDFLDSFPSVDQLSVIVSNPPYVTLAEKDSIRPNVLEFEPSIALFPPGPDPFIFYRRIEEFGREHLEPGGKVYLELPENSSGTIFKIFNSNKWTNKKLKKDLFGKERMFRAQLA